MPDERARILKLLADGRVNAEEASEMLEALEPPQAAGAAARAEHERAGEARERVIELLWQGRIDAGQATALLSALNGPPAPFNSFTLQAPSPGGRHLRLKWHDASGKLIEQVDVAAPLDDVAALHDMLPEAALELLDSKDVDLKHLAAQAGKLPAGTVVYHYDNDNAQGIEVRVEG